MNTINSLTLTLLGAVLAGTLAQAQPPPPPRSADRPDLDRKFERRRFIRHPGGPMEKENVTFLGVETAPVSPTLTVQLNLPKGTGLVVRHIVPESPAASALQPHDVLLKFDDQLLIEPRQFSVLVRNRQEGDQVTLTYIRAGKQATATLKLTKHEVPKIASGAHDNFESGETVFFDTSGPVPRVGREEMDHVLSLVSPGPIMKTRRLHQSVGSAGGVRATAVNPDNSNIVFSDEQGTLDLTVKDARKTLVAKNAKGEEVFSGPVTTPEERQALPPELRERLDRIEGMQEFSFETDEDFHDHLKILPTERKKITLPITPTWERSVPPPVL